MPPGTLFIGQVADTLYGLKMQSIESLAHREFDWRGIYHIRDRDNQSWVLRMMQLPDVLESFAATAQLLEWLKKAHYPAPSVQTTRTGEPAGWLHGWGTLLLSYVDGTPVARTPADLGLLAQTAGRLHTLNDESSQSLRPGRCHPDTITATMNQLTQAAGRVPANFQALLDDLGKAMEILQRHKPHTLTITHGDCWHENAIRRGNGSVVLVDWDNAGVGLPLLDLGYLLLTSHFDVSHPLEVKADEFIIRSILEGYQEERHIPQEDAQLLGEAMHFLPAFQIGKQIAEQESPPQHDFEFLLQKLRARHAATDDILAIGRDYLH